MYFTIILVLIRPGKSVSRQMCLLIACVRWKRAACTSGGRCITNVVQRKGNAQRKTKVSAFTPASQGKARENAWCFPLPYGSDESEVIDVKSEETKQEHSIL